MQVGGEQGISLATRAPGGEAGSQRLFGLKIVDGITQIRMVIPVDENAGVGRGELVGNGFTAAGHAFFQQLQARKQLRLLSSDWDFKKKGRPQDIHRADHEGGPEPCAGTKGDSGGL